MSVLQGPDSTADEAKDFGGGHIKFLYVLQYYIKVLYEKRRLELGEIQNFGLRRENLSTTEAQYHCLSPQG